MVMGVTAANFIASLQMHGASFRTEACRKAIGLFSADNPKLTEWMITEINAQISGLVSPNPDLVSLKTDIRFSESQEPHYLQSIAGIRSASVERG
jgi:hypothetical protein